MTAARPGAPRTRAFAPSSCPRTSAFPSMDSAFTRSLATAATPIGCSCRTTSGCTARLKSRVDAAHRPVQVVVFVPAMLREFAAGERRVGVEVVEPATLHGVFKQLHARHPGVVERTLDETWAQRPHVNIFVDGQ